MDEDDDPTRALDDFALRLPRQASADELTDLSDLLGRIAPGQTVPRQRAQHALHNGQSWNADDVVDVPLVERVPAATRRSDAAAREQPACARAAAAADLAAPPIDWPEVAAPARVGASELDAIDAACRTAHDMANDLAVTQFGTGTGDARDRPPDTQPALRSALARAADPRLLTVWKPGAWCGATREVFDAVTEFVSTPTGPAVETYPPHRLLALWPPQGLDAPLLDRWPQLVRLGAVDAEAAGAALLQLLPPEAELWLIHQDIDWALVAELVLHHDAGLRPFQLQGLRDFVEAERDTRFARLNSDYRPSGAGGEVERKTTTPKR